MYGMIDDIFTKEFENKPYLSGHENSQLKSNFKESKIPLGYIRGRFKKINIRKKTIRKG